MSDQLLSTQAYIDPLSPQVASPRDTQDWLLLHLFNLYRLTIAGLFVLTYFSHSPQSFFVLTSPSLFIVVAAVYLLFAVSNSVTIFYRWLPFNMQVIAQGLLDICAIVLLMHASGGISSGLGILLLIAIVGSSLLTEGRTAIFFAAVATLALLTEVMFADIYQIFDHSGRSYTQAGILGVSFFATAILSHVLAQRIRASEALARQRGLHVEYLSQLNEQIVQHMRSGIIVIDVLNRVRLFNHAAQKLLNLETKPDNQPLQEVLPELAVQVSRWRRNQGGASSLFRPPNGEVDVIASFTRLNRAGAVTVLILLEDATLTKRQAEQLKLASLGRLTASIAHEVRNPLAAISQAAQLLGDSPELERGDKRLTEIILEHSQRVNTIVENVLQLSRQREANIQTLPLRDWVERFVMEFAEARHLRLEDLEVKANCEQLTVYFDPIQLHQVAWNLCENGLRYTQGSPLLTLHLGCKESGRVFLDIRDYGKGIPEASAEHIFEPFFTTETQGTGLGLFLAREMCNANQAALQLTENTEAGVCFRIRFAILAELETE